MFRIIWLFLSYLVVVRHWEVGSNGQPSRPNGRISAKNLKSSFSEAKMLDDVKHLDRLVQRSGLGILIDDQVDVAGKECQLSLFALIWNSLLVAKDNN